MFRLSLDYQSQIYAPFIQAVGKVARLVRFDRRGNGLSDWDVDEISVAMDVSDMAAVAEAAGMQRFFILARNFGTAAAIEFAARHPERVLGIISLTAFVTGHVASKDVDRRRKYDVGKTIASVGTQSSDPTFLRYVATRIFPDGPPKYWAEVEEYYRASTSAPNFVSQYEAQHHLDVSKTAATLKLPLLIMHSKGCRLTPFSEATKLAALVQGASLIALDGEDAWPLPDTPAHRICLRETVKFLQTRG